MLPTFKTDLFNDSGSDKRFYGFHAVDIVLREAVADLDIDVVKLAVSIHWTGVTDSSGDWNGLNRGRNGWSGRTWLIDDQFSGINCRKNQNRHRFGRSRC